MDNVPMVQENEIIKFFRNKGDFLSEEGKKLITETDDSVIHEAAYEIPEILISLIEARNRSTDPYFRQKVIKAL